MTERLLISGRHQALCAADAARRVLEGGYRVKHVAALLEKIIDEVADTMDRMADKIGTELDEIEEKILAGETQVGHARQLGRQRRTCLRLHRQLLGLRVLFHRLEQRNVDHLSPALRLHAARLAQRLDGLDHDIVELRERSRLLEEEIRFKMEEESNRHLHTLSIVTTMLLPPTLVTGIFGMNTKGLPLTDVESGFLWAAALMIGLIRRGLLGHAALGHRQKEPGAVTATCVTCSSVLSLCSRRWRPLRRPMARMRRMRRSPPPRIRAKRWRMPASSSARPISAKGSPTSPAACGPGRSTPAASISAPPSIWKRSPAGPARPSTPTCSRSTATGCRAAISAT